MKTAFFIAPVFACLFAACRQSVDFRAFTVPENDSLATYCEAERKGDEWAVEVSVRNNSREEQVFKLALAAEPGFKADSWLIPGVNYDGNPIWKDVAALVWRYSTQGFADEQHRIWHGLERPVGSKNEAIFPARWSKYHLADKARGSINDHLTAWGGTYRLASLLELSEEGLAWLDRVTRPESGQGVEAVLD